MKKKHLIPLALAFLVPGVIGLTSCSNMPWQSEEKPIVDIYDVEYTLTLHIDGETTEILINKNNFFKLSENIPTIKDMAFDGWYTDENFKTACEFEEITNKNQVFNLYAKFVPAKTLTLSIVLDGTNTNYEIPRDTTFNLSTYVKNIEGKKFVGWFTDSDLTEKVSDTMQTMTSSKIFYGKYDDKEQYSLKIYYNGSVNEYTLYDGTRISLSDYFTKQDGYYLRGWYYDEGLTKKASNSFNISTDTNLYIDCFKEVFEGVTINSMSETLEKTTQVVTGVVGTTFDLTSYEKEIPHYTFEGWFYDETYETPVENPEEVGYSKNLQVYAKYKEVAKVNVYTKLFKTADASAYKTFYEDETVDLSNGTNQVLKEAFAGEGAKSSGLLFEGFYLDEDFTIPIPEEPVLLKEYLNGETSYTLYAKFKFKISIYINNELVNEFFTDDSSKKRFVHSSFYGEYITTDYDITSVDRIVIGGQEQDIKSGFYTITNPSSAYYSGKSNVKTTYNDAFEYTTATGGVTITKYTGDNTIVSIPSTIEGKKVIGIANGAFDAKIVQLTIPSSITSIPQQAFSNCKKLIEIYNYSNVSISKSVAKYIYTEPTESKLKVYKDEYIFYIDNDTNYLVSFRGNKKDVTLPLDYNGETYKLYDYAFVGSENMLTLIIPDGITEISNYCFKDCVNLLQVYIGPAVKKIGSFAFDNCYKIIEVWNDSLSLKFEQGSSAYGGLAENALDVYNVSLSDWVSWPEVYPFGFTIAQYETVSNDGQNFVLIKYDNKYYLIALDQTNGKTSNLTLPKTLTIKKRFPNTLTSTSTMTIDSYELYNHVFYKNDNILSLNVEMSGEIPTSAFESCTNLKDITISDSVTNISNYAFANCYRINTFKIPSSVLNVGDYAFYNCTNLILDTSQSQVETIGSNAFANCKALVSLVLPDTVQTIGEQAFYGCSSLTSMTIPFVGRTRTDETNYYFGYIFGGRQTDTGTINAGIPTGLKTLTVTDDEEFASQAFWRVTTLQQIILYKTTKLNDSTFGYCTNLRTISFAKDVMFDSVTETSFYQTSLKYIQSDYWSLVDMSETIKGLLTTAELQVYSDIDYDKTRMTIISPGGFTSKMTYDDIKNQINYSFEIVLKSGNVITKDMYLKLTNKELTLSHDFGYTTTDGVRYLKADDKTHTISTIVTLNNTNIKLMIENIYVFEL